MVMFWVMQKYQYRNHGLLKEVDEHLHVPLKFYSLLTGKLVSRFPTHHQSCKRIKSCTTESCTTEFFSPVLHHQSCTTEFQRIISPVLLNNFTWHRFPVKRLPIDSLLTSCGGTYFNNTPFIILWNCEVQQNPKVLFLRQHQARK